MRYILLVLVLLGFYGSPGAVLAADDNTLLTVRDDPYLFTAGEKEAKTRIRLVPGANAKKTETIGLAVAEVSHDGVTLSIPNGGITIAESVKADENGLYFIEPVLDTSAITGPVYGSYVVTLIASASLPGAEANDPPTEISETFDVTVTYPKVEFETPHALFVEQTCVFGMNCTTAATMLNLETKGSIGPTDLRIVQARNALHGDKRVSGTLEVQTPSGRDTLHKLAVKVSVPFPKGETTGTLRISSPEIERMNVDYKVVRHDGLFALGIVVVIGLIAGFALRTNLEKELQRGRRELKLKTLLQRVIESGEGVGDKALQNSLNEIASAIENRISDHAGVDDDALKTLVTGWETALKAALDKSAADAAATETALETLQDLARANWTVPLDVRDALESSLTDLEVIRQQIRDRQYDDATQQLETVQIGLHRSMVTSIEAWRVAVGDAMAALEHSLDKPLPDETNSDFTPIGSALQTAVGPVETQAGDDPNESMKTILKASHVALNAANRLLYSLRRDIDATAARVTRILDTKLSSDAAADLETAREQLAAMKPENWTEQPDSGNAELEQVVSGVTAAMTQAVRSVQEPVADETEDHLARGEYRKAALEAVKPRIELTESLRTGPRTAGAGGADLLQDGDVAGMYVGSLHANWVDTREPALRRAHSVDYRAAQIARLKLEKAETALQIARREMLQTGVAWVGLTVVALFIFGDSFVGTYQDYIKVFLWGFTTDAGVGTLLERAKAKVQ
ncbi:MAG: hypothetical protein NXI27_19845 [Alphaproteobacteria bacterium]|nr:hypothetical protein [Alphaproteobacteria bacterium]